MFFKLNDFECGYCEHCGKVIFDKPLIDPKGKLIALESTVFKTYQNYVDKIGRSEAYNQSLEIVKKQQKIKQVKNCLLTAIGTKSGNGNDISKFIRCKSWRCEFCHSVNSKQWFSMLLNEVEAKDETKRINYKTCSILTLTCEDFPNEKELSRGFVHLWEMIKYYSKKQGFKNPSYFSVFEYQENGRLHIHSILRDVPKIDVFWLSSSWKLGKIVFINRFSRKKGKNIACYLFKYLVKDKCQFERDKKFGLSKKVRYSYNFFKNSKIKESREKQKHCEHDFKPFKSQLIKRFPKKKIKIKQEKN